MILPRAIPRSVRAIAPRVCRPMQRQSLLRASRRRFCDTQKKKSVKTTEGGQQNTAISTFVVIKEKTEEGLSFIYVMGVLFCVLPGAIFMVGKSLLSESGSDNVRSKSYDLILEDAQCRHILGEDMFARQTSHHSEYTDDAGVQHVTVIYELKGNKTDARVDAEMKLVDNEWEWEFVIVTAPYGTIYVVDNRSHYTQMTM